jgi:acetoin utilization deacetylase AcuC-like enzyme
MGDDEDDFDPGRPGLLSRLAAGVGRLARGIGIGGLGRRPVDLVYGRAYRLELPATATDPLRGERILAFLLGAGLADRRRIHAPEPATFRELQRVHAESYLEALPRPGALAPILGFDLPDPFPDRVLAAQRAMAGGTLLAVRLALARGGIAVNLGGGLHHAFRDRGERFCALNDVAVAITAARAEGFAGPVLVVDLDLHDGDGTRTILAEDPSVHLLSIHNLTTAPVAANSTVVELGGEVEDAAYLAAVDAHLPALVRRLEPALAIYLAGCDPAADDAIGNWRISPAGMLARDRRVVEALGAGGRAPVPLAIVLAGGYGGNAWTYTARLLAWLLSGRAVEPPSAAELTLDRFRGVAARLSPRELSGDGRAAAGDDFGLTAEDLAAAGGIPARSRFLGFYSRQGLELAVERSGFLERLRARGFPRLALDLELDNPGGETLRIRAPGVEEPLLELRARRDRATVPGLELLRIEWLLLQDPRARFTPERPRLPGQRHPGLGLLQEVMALMVLACDRLHLDGVLFVPAHYHTAAQGRRRLRFLSPQADGRFRALEEALAGLPLPRAAAAVEEGRVIDGATGRPFRWEPAPLLLPVSARAEERVTGEAYEEAARAAREATSLRLLPPPPARRRARPPG